MGAYDGPSLTVLKAAAAVLQAEYAALNDAETGMPKDLGFYSAIAIVKKITATLAAAQDHEQADMPPP